MKTSCKIKNGCQNIIIKAQSVYFMEGKTETDRAYTDFPNT